jgi:hypothetical protein
MEFVRPMRAILDRFPLLPLPDRGPVEPVPAGERAHAKGEVRISSRIAGVVRAHGCRRMTMGEATESAGPRAPGVAAWATGNTGGPFAQAKGEVLSTRPGHEQWITPRRHIIRRHGTSDGWVTCPGRDGAASGP